MEKRNENIRGYFILGFVLFFFERNSLFILAVFLKAESLFLIIIHFFAVYRWYRAGDLVMTVFCFTQSGLGSLQQFLDRLTGLSG